MARKTHDLAVVVGEYTDQQGQTKKRYQNVGALMQGDNGPFVMLAKWFNPAGVPDARGGESLLVSCFEPRQRQGNASQQSGQAAPTQEAPNYADFDDDSIPF
jgi:single-stranded DNA-binding protein